MTVKNGAARIVFAAVVLAVMTFGGCSNPANDDDPKGPGTPEVPDADHDVVINMDTAGLPAAVNGVIDLDAKIAAELPNVTGANGKLKIDLGASQGFGISQSNWNNAKVQVVSGVRKHAKEITTEAELNDLPATVLYASTTAANIALTPTGTAIAFTRAGGALLTPFAPSAAKVWTDPDGTKLPRKLTKDVVVFFHNNANVTDGATAKSQMLSLYGIAPKDGQAVGTMTHVETLPWFDTSDVSLVATCANGGSPENFPGLTIPGLGTISAGDVPSFTYNLSASLNKQPKYTLKSVLGNIKVSQATYVAAVSAQKQGLYS